jgi:glycosyltransferase involved in cell wall biosynthesis
MRVAAFGNLANNAYILVRLLRQVGVDAELILDPFDDFIMSDPRWEDLDLEISTQALSAESLPNVALPPWVWDTRHLHFRRWPMRARLAVWAIHRPAGVIRDARLAGPRGAAFVAAYAPVIRRLATYDCAIVNGVGPIVATHADVPFLVQPFGGDITIIPFADGDGWQGQDTPGTRPPHVTGAHAYVAVLQRAALPRASRILVGDPAFYPYIERLGLRDKAVSSGLLVDSNMYAPGDERELRRDLLHSPDGILVFVPARQDWYWKGSNLMLEGYARAIVGRRDVTLVCAGWGADVDRSRRLIAELGIADRVRLLPHAMSKRRLLRYYRAADLVMDQFTLGSYGGSALEAMSCARPLVMYLDRDRFARRFDVSPPVVNAREPEEIGVGLGRLFDDPAFRADLGQRARKWVMDYHGNRLLEHVIELCVDASRKTARHSA